MDASTVQPAQVRIPRWSAATDGTSRPSSKSRNLLIISILLLIAILLSPRSILLIYLFPAFAVFAGWSLLRTSPAVYTGFTLWIWFLAPLIRRLVDFRSGTNAASPILLAPYLASCVPLYYFFRRGQGVVDRGSAPLLYMSAAVFYGFVVGLSNFSTAAAVQGLLTWIAPLCFAFFLYQNRANFRPIFRAFEITMIYGTLVAGAYGIYQYFALPKWDALWMENLGNVTFGSPQPLQVRVFSILNAPQILALFLVAGILLALHSKDRIRFLAVPVGALCLAFSMARTAWVSFLLGLFYLLSRARLRLRLQIVMVGVLSLVAFGLALQDPRVAVVVSQRINSLSDVSHDESFVSRGLGYEALFVGIADYPFGLGLGGQATGSDAKEYTVTRGGESVMQSDSSLAAVIISLGGAGALLAAVSFFLLVSAILRLKAKSGSSAEAMKMLTLVLASELLFNNIVSGPSGFLAWTILGLCLAAGAAPVVSTVETLPAHRQAKHD